MDNAEQGSSDFNRRPGRPRMGKERRIAVTLTMAPQIADKLNELAYKQDLSRSRFVELLAIQSIANSRRSQ